MRRPVLVLLLAAAVAGLAGASIAPADAAQGPQAKVSTAASPPGLGGFPALRCQDGAVAGAGPVKHVIYLQFDNVHLQRNLASVPSRSEEHTSELQSHHDLVCR